MNNIYWKHKYFEKSSYELHSNIFKSLEIENYLKKILKNYGFNLYDYKLNFSNSTINIFLSIYKTERKIITSKKKITLTNKDKFIKIQKKIKNYYKKKSIKNSSVKLEYIKTLKLYKNCLIQFQKNNRINESKNISKKIIDSLNIFTKNKFNITVTIQEINFVNLHKKIKQTLTHFRKFEKTPFFNEGTTLFTPLITQKNSAKLLSEFIASQLRTKRHNFFFNFLKENLNLLINKKFSKIEGIKIIVKGRLNNAARSKHHIIKVGRISLIKIKSTISYYESVGFTSNGTIGVKTWICEKK